ncbi:MAG TPA: selenoneine biosynthesis selenosugar synthase SenB [Candidatus Binatia bacterium]|nr:selenoneine biosynthesis selenosugar synthase SenB [Candidatus Binatia bacterium]
MKIQLVTPAPLKINNGNKITALRWASMFKKLGHRVRVRQVYDGKPCDVMIALHALRSADSIRRFHDTQPTKPLIVVLTGTDVYRDIHESKEAQQSLELATRIVALQKMALRELPTKFRAKTQVIYQSAVSLRLKNNNANHHFNICVVGHLREEKDPLRTALAVRDLAPASQIQVTHVGEALDKTLGAKARSESLRNQRYRWIGQLSHRKTRELVAQSQLVCITSRMEGSSNVLSEALASGVPVICSKIPGLVGTLGNKFSGFYSVGDTDKLRRLLQRVETDKKFYRALKRQCRRLAPMVKPKRELDAWRKILKEISPR